MEKLSILIPVYNVEKYIEKAIQSVLEQTYSNFELILLNDGSTDESLSIIERYAQKDNRIKYASRDNRGLLKTRIDLINMATGKYSMFLDADDWIERETLEKMYKLIKKNECDVVRCNKVKEVIQENRKIYMQHFNINEKKVNFEEFQEKVYPYFINTYICNSVVAQLIKTKYLKEIDINLDVSMAEDLNFNLDLYSKIKSISFMEDYFYHYRYNNESITTSNINLSGISKKVNDVKFVYSQLLEYIKKWNMDTEKNREIIMKRIINEMLICTKQLSKIREIKIKHILNFINETFGNDIIDYKNNIKIEKTDSKLLKLFYYSKYKKMARYIKYNIYYDQLLKYYIKKIIYKGNRK